MVHLDRQLEGGSYEDLAFGQTNFQTNDIFFALDVVEIKNEEVLTCIPDLPGGYMPTRNVLCDAMIRDSPLLLMCNPTQLSTHIWGRLEQKRHLILSLATFI